MLFLCFTLCTDGCICYIRVYVCVHECVCVIGMYVYMCIHLCECVNRPVTVNACILKVLKMEYTCSSPSQPRSFLLYLVTGAGAKDTDRVSEMLMKRAE